MVPFQLKFLLMGEYLCNFNYIFFLNSTYLEQKKPQGPKELENIYQWGNTSQNFVSAEPDTLRKADLH